MDIGLIIANHRRELGLKQRDIATALCISPTYLSDIELGRREFPRDRLARLPQPIRAAVAAEYIEQHRRGIDDLSRFVDSAA